MEKIYFGSMIFINTINGKGNATTSPLLNTIKLKGNLIMSKSIYTPSKQFCKQYYYPIDDTGIPKDAEPFGWGIGGYVSEEHYKQLSVDRIGNGNPFYGKKHTPETRAKMGHQKRCKPIMINNIKYKSSKEAAEKLGYSKAWVSKQLKIGKAIRI